MWWSRSLPRLASWIAASAMPKPSTSVSMWPASDSRASESLSRPPTTSTTMNAAQQHEGDRQPPLVPLSCPDGPVAVIVPVRTVRVSCGHGKSLPACIG